MPYIDLLSAVHYLLLQSSSSSSTSSDSATTTITSLRTELITAFDTKLQENKKPKDKVVSILNGETNKVDLTMITSSLCIAALSSSLQCQVITSYLSSVSACQRQGFVLDIWENETLREIQRYLPPDCPIDVIVQLKVNIIILPIYDLYLT